MTPTEPTSPPSPPVPPATPAPDTLTPAARLEAYVDKLNERIEDARNIFNENEYTPFNSKAFKKFITDQFCEVTMRYILMGTVREGDAANTEERMKAAGFTVAGSAPAPAKEEEERGFTAPSVPMPQESGSDDADVNHHLVRQACELGFDPTVDPED